MKLGYKELVTASGSVYATVYFDQSSNTTIDIWTGPFETTENFEKGLTLVLENIKEFKTRKWLADLSLMEGDFDFAKDFIARNIIPKAMELGLEREALVLPHNIFSLISVQEVGLQMINHFELRMFETRIEAATWLNSCE